MPSDDTAVPASNVAIMSVKNIHNAYNAFASSSGSSNSPVLHGPTKNSDSVSCPHVPTP